jgi:hypothetical protein
MYANFESCMARSEVSTLGSSLWTTDTLCKAVEIKIARAHYNENKLILPEI